MYEVVVLWALCGDVSQMQPLYCLVFSDVVLGVFIFSSISELEISVVITLVIIVNNNCLSSSIEFKRNRIKNSCPKYNVRNICCISHNLLTGNSVQFLWILTKKAFSKDKNRHRNCNPILIVLWMKYVTYNVDQVVCIPSVTLRY